MTEINILELVYGGSPEPDSKPIHRFDINQDAYEHAEFYKENGDFYQIVEVHLNLVLFHFQKVECKIYENRIDDFWWLKHDKFQRKYVDRPGIFHAKIQERLDHGYLVRKLVMSNKIGLIISLDHPDKEAISKNIYGVI